MRLLIIALLLIAIVSGCVSQKPESSTPQKTEVPATPPPSENEEIGIESDLEQIDAMFNDSSIDIPIEVNVSTFT